MHLSSLACGVVPPGPLEQEQGSVQREGGPQPAFNEVQGGKVNQVTQKEKLQSADSVGGTLRV